MPHLFFISLFFHTSVSCMFFFPFHQLAPFCQTRLFSPNAHCLNKLIHPANFEAIFIFLIVLIWKKKHILVVGGTVLSNFLLNVSCLLYFSLRRNWWNMPRSKLPYSCFEPLLLFETASCSDSNDRQKIAINWWVSHLVQTHIMQPRLQALLEERA